MHPSATGTSTRSLHDALPIYDAACMLGERQQQGELITGERARRAVKPHFAGAAVDLETPVTQQVGFGPAPPTAQDRAQSDRKSTRLNSSHLGISYAVFCLKKK